MLDTPKRHAQLFRMVTPEHICPFGLKTLDLLNREGFVVEDNLLSSRGQTDAFKAVHGVETTPQVFIHGECIGGYDDTLRFLGKEAAKVGA